MIVERARPTMVQSDQRSPHKRHDVGKAEIELGQILPAIAAVHAFHLLINKRVSEFNPARPHDIR